MKPTQITVGFPDGTLTVSRAGVKYTQHLTGAETLSNEELFSLVTHVFDNYAGVREALGLKKGDSLHKRMCPKHSLKVTETSGMDLNLLNCVPKVSK